jgi:hypothetical protein
VPHDSRPLNLCPRGLPPQELAEASWNGLLVDGGVTTGDPDAETCLSLCTCALGTSSCSVLRPGVVSCLGSTGLCTGGRAPPTKVVLSAVDDSAGSWLARMAEFEGAAVDAFVHLARELEAHGLGEFSQAAMAAAEDEVRHTEQVTRVALSHGRCPVHRPLARAEVRTLEAMAIDNAAEGCGRELFGAMVNAHQARTASDPRVASLMGQVAADELGHARLSFELAEALMPRLTLAQRRRAREAQAQTLTAMASDNVPARLRHTLGLMDEAQAQATSRGLLDHSRL